MKREELLAHAPELRPLFERSQQLTRKQAGPNRNPNFCHTQEWYALPRDRGEIGQKHFFLQFVRTNEWLGLHYEHGYRALVDAIPPCAKGKRCDCKVDFAIPALTPEQERGIAEGTLVVLKRDPDFEFAPPDDKFAPHDIDQMVDEVFA